MTALAALCLLASACGAAEKSPEEGMPPGRTVPGQTGPGASATATPADSPGTGGATGPSSSPNDDASLVAGRYQPLWPFADHAQARSWTLSYRSGGHQPWHLDADQTALSFTQGYLGFKDIDRVISRTVKGTHARVAVGFRGEEGGRAMTAAVLHLVKFGDEADAPWEVVGTDDTTLSLTTPAYGASVASPVQAGGRITGVDESIRVQARHPASEDALGESGPVQAGGTDQPWSATLAFHATPGQTVTLVVSTGGHIAEVERFAVTGVRLTPGGG
ncbi:hypothetical protein Mth01_35940 [Sphaerimonospora thailandensis]|uniref:Uncharacterized protein n=2 Tax=Sphaerimonospora thailandensis TaxID=795644 RepID=A0A8J3W119_9ACTN|nr:hypothetical protein Mth01_35940 [Sphaerimonospora thailandensis]